MSFTCITITLIYELEIASYGSPHILLCAPQITFKASLPRRSQGLINPLQIRQTTF